MRTIVGACCALSVMVSVAFAQPAPVTFRARFAPFASNATAARMLRVSSPDVVVLPDAFVAQQECDPPQAGVLCAYFITPASPGEELRFRLCQSNGAGEACTGCGGATQCDTPDRFATIPTATPTATVTPTTTATASPTLTPTRSPTPVLTATRTATRTPTPSPTRTPTPTATPTPVRPPAPVFESVEVVP